MIKPCWFPAGAGASGSLSPFVPRETAATKMPGEEIFSHSRKPAIMGDAAHWILIQDSSQCSGKFFIDEKVLRDNGMTNFDVYANDPSRPLYLDLLVDEPDGHYFRGD